MKKSKLPFLFGASIATFIVIIWLMGRLNLIQMADSYSTVFFVFVLLFCLPLAVLLWCRFLRSPVAIEFERGFLILGSIENFPRKVRIPMGSIEDALLVEKKVYGESLLVLRITVSDDTEIRGLRSSFRSVAYFGFVESFFDCAFWNRSRGEQVVAEIQSRCKGRG